MNSFGVGGEEWDDSELVKSYERAVKNWRKSKGSGSEEPSPSGNIGPWVPVKKEENTNNLLDVGSWVLGSPCRAVWTTDGLEYEAKIVAVEGPKCTIRFVGYGNQEVKDMSELKETFGKRSRDRQRREAQTQNSQYLTVGVGNAYNMNNEGEDYFSSVSLTSSMCNNCPSIVNDRERDDDQLTTTTDFSGVGGKDRESVSSSTALKPQRKSAFGKRKHPDVDSMSVDNEQDPAALDIDGRADDILPSGAEATMGSSSSTSDISEEGNQDGDDEATSAAAMGGGGNFPELKGFPSMMPQFPIPPLPMSLADSNGKFDFGRGQLPSLLLSWYMSGYHAGYFDAQHEKNKNPRGPADPSRSKRQ